MAAGLAVTAAALAASGQRGAGEGADRPRLAVAPQPGHRPARAVELVSAPVRIADAETVRLLRPGDRVDVIAAPSTADAGPVGGAAEEPPARVLARGARVAEVPRADRHIRQDGDIGADDGSGVGAGALVVLSVPRATAATLAGAGAASRLAVVVC
ncbi:RcpC/CpaB family pilus assembly protein [Streptomyces sp. ODS05-4]|uniref:RcpC/CpaB family pilus assembly protein n=1 Tax=Streptomyces sp. ODS05-4 TaxID=2944939 RepID=UPI0027E55A44|nr:RcpC/CpaB family pilus assembly protein [Streptomyces sp. ODS05-4]